MSHVLAVYDIPKALKVANPSPYFRRFGVRVNLSCWIFPEGSVPVSRIDRLRDAGVIVHLVEFAEKAQDKIIDLARQELRHHAREVAKKVKSKCSELRGALEIPIYLGIDMEPRDKVYKRWRAILNRARRELVSAEACSTLFAVSGDCMEAFDGLRAILSAETTACDLWRDQQKAAGASPVAVAAESAPALEFEKIYAG